MLGVLVAACAHSAPAPVAAPRAPVVVLSPSGDAELDELRRWAVVVPIADLLDRLAVFASLVGTTYRSDPILWQGVARAADALLAGHDAPQRRLTARYLAQVIEQGIPEFAAPLHERAVRLRRIE